MLVLSRKVNEEIVIGEKIRVKLVKLGRGRVRLAISAPPGIGIRRAEIATAASSEQADAPESETIVSVIR